MYSDDQDASTRTAAVATRNQASRTLGPFAHGHWNRLGGHRRGSVRAEDLN